MIAVDAQVTGLDVAVSVLKRAQGYFTNFNGVGGGIDLFTQGGREQMERNAFEGRDKDGKAFAPYSERTKKQRAKKGQPTSRVTLRDTGAMFQDLKVTPRNGMFTVGFVLGSRSAMKAEKHALGQFGLPIRNFMGVPQADLAVLTRNLEAGIASITKS
ncbi:MAG: hypothetical protein R8M45_06500 [Ghiorsea sp.]